MLVLDASVVVAACGEISGFEMFGDEHLLAPPHMWAEARSGVHEARWRNEISSVFADGILENLQRAPVRMRAPRALGVETWRIADEFGWAKTYDAEYVALARLTGCRLVTLDARLLRGTQRLGFVVGPADL